MPANVIDFESARSARVEAKSRACYSAGWEVTEQADGSVLIVVDKLLEREDALRLYAALGVVLGVRDG